MSKIRAAIIGAGRQEALPVHYRAAGYSTGRAVRSRAGQGSGHSRALAGHSRLSRLQTDAVGNRPGGRLHHHAPQDWLRLAAEALRQHRHVFTEQPPVVTTTQIQWLAQLATQHDCTTMVGYQRRYIPALIARVEGHGSSGMGSWSICRLMASMLWTIFAFCAVVRSNVCRTVRAHTTGRSRSPTLRRPSSSFPRVLSAAWTSAAWQDSASSGPRFTVET